MGRATRAVTALIVVVLGLAAAARADAAKPTAVVAMGDSYISGEAGRWAGNSATGVALTKYDGTDRGTGVYGSSGDCHRSDVAEVNSATIPVDKRINISCSGAVTSDLLTTAEGGTSDHSEPPQGDQLKTVAADNDVKAIIVSIGGNDLGFASIVLACYTATPANPCKPEQQKKLTAGLPAARTKIEGVIDSIRKVMKGAGYADGSYRLILQSYPSVVPRAAENRYPQGSRVSAGCNFTDVDSDWARDSASKQIGGAVADATLAKGAEYLDLGDLFQGHEVCSKTARQADVTTPASSLPAAQSEWGRPVLGPFALQGQTQEYFHPDAIGQQAFGACFGAIYAAKPGRYSCASAAGRAPKDVIFKRLVTTTTPTPTPRPTPVPTATKKRPLRLAAYRLRPKHRGRRVCVRFTARSNGKPVKGARVAYRGERKRTGRRGRATICDRYAYGKRTHHASARKAGYRRAKRSFAFRVRPKQRA